MRMGVLKLLVTFTKRIKTISNKMRKTSFHHSLFYLPTSHTQILYAVLSVTLQMMNMQKVKGIRNMDGQGY